MEAVQIRARGGAGAGAVSVSPPVLDGQICPYIDYADARCAKYLSLSHIQDAFEVCICTYSHCPVYSQLKHERPQAFRPGLSSRSA